MKSAITLYLFFGLSMMLEQGPPSQESQSCPMHEQHMKAAMQHQAAVEKHGDQAMGFSHENTTHHFRLHGDGGAIEVTANKSRDVETIQAIRDHMTHIAAMFSSNDFSIPMFVHDQVPPGVPAMKEKHAEITYTFEELPTGATVRIKSSNLDALKAIHEFLLFQITDHDTGDATVPTHESH